MALDRTRIFWRAVSANGVTSWSPLGERIMVPTEVEMQAVGARGGPDTSIRFRVVNGVPEVVQVQVEQSPDGRGVRREDIRAIPGLEDLARTAFTLFAREVDPERFDPTKDPTWNLYQATTRVLPSEKLEGEVTIHVRLGSGEENMIETVGVPVLVTASPAHVSTNREYDRAVTRKRAASRAELEQVAEIYRRNLDKGPTDAVRRYLACSERTAARRVQQARGAGLLPPTTKGKKRA